ncbi:hypothetical protein B0J12DRAFT_321054 [Macrophomina phaseolina]|uniref:Transmembrane protein n=1 Tax=Macrophomina phaseolina TaxID=35725 RepID=A0ABQ8FVW9_9PEZI|nr:hypothetical protein B0J12DRAFT_321054 [Macrophomina phaseolina]
MLIPSFVLDQVLIDFRISSSTSHGGRTQAHGRFCPVFTLNRPPSPGSLNLVMWRRFRASDSSLSSAFFFASRSASFSSSRTRLNPLVSYFFLSSSSYVFSLATGACSGSTSPQIFDVFTLTSFFNGFVSLIHLFSFLHLLMAFFNGSFLRGFHYPHQRIQDPTWRLYVPI